MKDIFQLAEEEKEAREYRISQVLCGGLSRGTNRETRALIASHLYKAKWSGNTHEEGLNMTHEAILENFCWNIFGASLEEVLKAWDKFLG